MLHAVNWQAARGKLHAYLLALALIALAAHVTASLSALAVVAAHRVTLVDRGWHDGEHIAHIAEDLRQDNTSLHAYFH